MLYYLKNPKGLITKIAKKEYSYRKISDQIVYFIEDALTFSFEKDAKNAARLIPDCEICEFENREISAKTLKKIGRANEKLRKAQNVVYEAQANLEKLRDDIIKEVSLTNVKSSKILEKNKYGSHYEYPEWFSDNEGIDVNGLYEILTKEYNEE